MTIQHVKSVTIGDFTGTVTGYNSAGITQTIAATDLQRPSDWNSVHNQLYTLTGNTLGASTVSGTNVLFAASGNVSISGAAGSVVFYGSDPVISGYVEPLLDREMIAAQIGQNSLFIQPLRIREAVAFNEVVLPVNYSNATNSSNSFTVTFNVGLYTRNGNTLSLYDSASTSYAVTNSGTVGSYSLYGGLRMLPVGMTETLPVGNYWIGVHSRTTTGGGAGMSMSQFVGSQIASVLSGRWSSANNATNQYVLGLGSYSSTTTALPVSIPFSSILGSGSANVRPLVYQLAFTTT